MNNLRSAFPALDNYTYLNTATHGLISQKMAAHRTGLIETVLKDPVLALERQEGIISETREKVATFLDAPTHLTGLLPNFSIAFNLLLGLIPRSKKFLLVQGDYPSINWAVDSMGFSCMYAQLDENLEHHIKQQVIKEQPDFLCLSLVQYISGIKIDFEFIKQLKIDFPNLTIIVDGTQYVGSGELRFRESGIDILIASCYKWLHAGEGNAFITFQPNVANLLKPNNFQDIEPDSFNNARGCFMGIFEPGHHNLIATSSLGAAIDEFNCIGQLRIYDRVDRIGKLARAAFEKRGLIDQMVVAREQHSSIFNLRGDVKLFNHLQDNHVICALRGDGVRVSFHFFNTEDELHYLTQLLDQFL
ncbi:MAG: aminotransferase class V-fold PLP-dependent enzyme [Nonlabens sp.]